MPQNPPVRICLITGYLGAGKTTLLNHILANREGIRAAVIVNDIGEINVDAELIARTGAVSEADRNLIPLSNGCICCTLADDLAKQLTDLAETGRYSDIIIEASGICEPIPIAQTITMMCEENTEDGLAMRLDNIVAVVDCARMLQEFENGRLLIRPQIGEDDIENLLIQQIEFCSTLLLNKTDLVSPGQLGELRAIVRMLQRDAVFLECTKAEVPVSALLDTGRFDLDRALASAGWAAEIRGQGLHGQHEAQERDHEHEHEVHERDREHHGAHEHHHAHHEHAGRASGHEPESEELLEYGIETFLYERRRPFRHDLLSAFCRYWPHEIIRCKGMVWYEDDPATSYMFEQAGRQITESPSGAFLAAAPEELQQELLEKHPEIRKVWDSRYGDRMIRLVFIGKDMDQDYIIQGLDRCLGE